MSYLFLSPTEESKRNKGAITVSSYRPSIAILRPLLISGTGGIVIGLSPVLSLSLTLGRLGAIHTMRVITIGGRYGRLLLVLRGRSISSRMDVRYRRVTNGKRDQRCAFALGQRGASPYLLTSRIKACLCRPGTTVLGTNTFHSLARACPITGLRLGDRLCASISLIPSFPKHHFQIRTMSNFKGGRLGTFLVSVSGTGVAVHGFPLSITRLHGHLGLGRKKSSCVFTAALSNKRGILVEKGGY